MPNLSKDIVTILTNGFRAVGKVADPREVEAALSTLIKRDPMKLWSAVGPLLRSKVSTTTEPSMRTLTAREAGHYVGRLEKISHELQDNYEALGLDQKTALDFAFEVDAACDEIERTSMAAAKAATDKQSKLLQGDPQDPEPYMNEAFNDDPGYIEGKGANPDEPYMETFNYQGGGEHPTAGSGSVVSERTESPVQGLSEYADGFKKQPSQPYTGGTPFPEDGRKASSNLFKGGRYQRQTKSR